MKRRLGLVLTLSMVLVMILQGFLSSIVWAKDDEPPGTGLLEPTAEQTEWMHKNFPVIRQIHLNRLAVQRINNERRVKGLNQISESAAGIAPMGQEAVTDSSGTLAAETVADLVGALPAEVDNSLSPAFPPIRSQGSIGSCACWSTTYYQFTYETNLALGRTASGGDNTVIFSPKWSYNMINRGTDGGSSFADAYALEQKNGAATWAEFPYDSNYLAWCMDPAAWSDAINYRALSRGQISNSNIETLIGDVKTQLANGHVVVVGTYVSSWVQKTVSNDSSTADDDTLAGQKIASYMTNTKQGGHGMTIVGYNDSLWCDLNANNTVDAGEKGAFKIANSWGTSDWNKGYRWVAYDALRITSSAPSAGSWPVTNRSSSGIFWSGNMYTLTANPAYTPSLIAEVTLNQAERSQLSISLGIGDTTAVKPATTWTSKAVYNSGGNYAFNGSTTACDGTFYFDFTDLAKSVSGAKRWFVGVSDNTAGDVSTIKSYKLYQVTPAGKVLAATCGDLPKSSDAGQTYAWVDYALGTVNQPPAASIAASTTSGNLPLNVSFDGSASRDPDGQITAYAWTFGDGSTAAGASVSHTYTAAGLFTASLKITDDKGATGSSSVSITVVNPNNQAPIASISASPVNGSIPLSVKFDGTKSTDPDGQISAYAWNFGDGSTGTGATITHSYTGTGNFAATLTVKDNQGLTGSAGVTITATGTVTIIAPTRLTASLNSRTVTLKWTDNSNNEEGFYIERATRYWFSSYSSYSRVGQTAANVSSFAQSDQRGTYKYRVRAYNLTTGKVSPYSNEVVVQVN